MLQNFQVKKDKAHIIPAVLPLNNSSRVQTLKRSDNKILYDLILCFKQHTGVPLLCNTSLNDKGEPIINTAREALNFALRKNICIVYLNKIRVTLKNFLEYRIRLPLERTKF